MMSALADLYAEDVPGNTDDLVTSFVRDRLSLMASGRTYMPTSVSSPETVLSNLAAGAAAPAVAAVARNPSLSSAERALGARSPREGPAAAGTRQIQTPQLPLLTAPTPPAVPMMPSNPSEPVAGVAANIHPAPAALVTESTLETESTTKSPKKKKKKIITL